MLLACVIGSGCSGDDGTRRSSTSAATASTSGSAGSNQRGSTTPPRDDARVTRAAAPAFGVKFDRFRAGFGGSREYLDALPGGGMTWYEVEWCAIEPSEGARDWKIVDDAVDDAEQLDWQLVLKIRTGSCWATGGRIGEPAGNRRMTVSVPPTDLDAYAQFVRAVVERYAPRGVHGYAIENEVNALNFWQSTADDYETLARTAADAIRGADPDAVVYDGGISSAGYGAAIARELLDAGDEAAAVDAYNGYYERRFSTRADDYWPVEDAAQLRAALASERGSHNLSFVDATFELARDGVFDVFQVHFYERWDNVPALMDLLRARLPAGMPIEALEVGIFNPDDQYDEATQAAELTKTISLLMAGGARRVVALPLAYNPDGREREEIRWGLLDPESGAPRLAAGVLTTLAQAASTGAEWAAISGGGATGVAVGTGTGAETTVVLWSDAATSLPGRSRAVTGRRVDGSEVRWGPAGLELDDVPVILTVPEPIEAIGSLP